MARFSVSQKAQRVLKFTMGLRNNKAHSMLAPYGFGEDDLREGLELLAAVVRQRLSQKPAPSDAKLLAQLDEFENLWFPIVRATLKRHHPQVGEDLMLNLGTTTGIAVTMTVATFIERLSLMGAGAAPYGPEGSQARALLTERGLSDAVIAEVAALLSEVAALNDEPVVDYAAEARQAEDAMWQWYLEWSAIARRAIKNRNVLRRLGFLQRSRGDASEEEVEGADDVDSNVIVTESSTGVIASPRLVGTSPRAQLPADTEVSVGA